MKNLFHQLINLPFPRLWMPIALYVSLGLILSGISLHLHPRSPGEVAALLLSGVFAWTLIEYGLHRFVFHLKTEREPWKVLTSGFHMSHHHAIARGETDFVITRPAGSLPFAIVFYLLFSLLLWSFSAAALLMTGVFVGYLLYEYAHYAAHRFQPSGRFAKFLKNYHLQHHFMEGEGKYGVTSPVWDKIFGSATMKKETVD